MGALDPHTHKLNMANLKGEGKLEMEGVRPQRYAPAAAPSALDPRPSGAVLVTFSKS